MSDKDKVPQKPAPPPPPPPMLIIDKTLFEKLKGRKTTIYYQDPNASETLIKQLVNSEETDIICERSKTDVFILPYEF